MTWRGRELAVWFVVAVIYGMTMMNPGPVQGQGVLPPAEMTTSGQPPQTNIIPKLTISERYDSNVIFIRGNNFEDYVTTVSPQLHVDHRNRFFKALVGGGGTAETYVKNPGLNYIAGNGMLDLNLSGLTNELVSGLGLHIRDTFQYTPQPTAFGAPEGVGSDPTDVYVRGLQARRANSFTNGGTATASYEISPLVSFNSTYVDSRRRFGSLASVQNSTATTATSFINTNFQTVTSGPVIQASPVDSLSLSHQYQQGSFNVHGSKTGFSTQGAIAGWKRQFTPLLTGALTAGFALFNQSDTPRYLGSASLAYKSLDLDASLSYSRVIAPSFITVGAPLLSQRVTGMVTHRVTEPLSLSINAYYAINESVPDSSLIKFESYSVMSSGSYKITRELTATLSYTHNMFTQTHIGQSTSFDRNIVLLRLVAEWK
jgi:hypothetical protein